MSGIGNILNKGKPQSCYLVCSKPPTVYSGANRFKAERVHCSLVSVLAGDQSVIFQNITSLQLSSRNPNHPYDARRGRQVHSPLFSR